MCMTFRSLSLSLVATRSSIYDDIDMHVLAAAHTQDRLLTHERIVECAV